VAQQADAAPDVAATTMLARFEDLIALAAERRDLQTKTALERDLRLVRFEPGRLEIALEPNASKALIGDLGRRISQWTGQRWMVVVSGEQGQPTVRSQIDARRAELERGVQADPLVKAVLARFPGAQIVAVREGLPDAPPPSIEGDVLPPEPPIDDDSSVFAEHIRPDDSNDDP
jgi:DNA polymerase-3 subunit gamma/tau